MKLPDEVPILSYGAAIDAKEALRNCAIGLSFVVDTEKHRQRIIGFSNRMGIVVQTKRNEHGRFQVWRIS